MFADFLKASLLFRVYNLEKIILNLFNNNVNKLVV